MIKSYIIPADGHKSFYGKAILIDDEKGTRTLESYNTPVCKLVSDGAFIKLWDGYSATTMRHVNGFRAHCRLPQINKAAWDRLETGKKYQCMTLESMEG